MFNGPSNVPWEKRTPNKCNKDCLKKSLNSYLIVCQFNWMQQNLILPRRFHYIWHWPHIYLTMFHENLPDSHHSPQKCTLLQPASTMTYSKCSYPYVVVSITIVVMIVISILHFYVFFESALISNAKFSIFYNVDSKKKYKNKITIWRVVNSEHLYNTMHIYIYAHV